jgi:3',5'-cyclic AMP phosphodiesterase CpdA
MEALDAIVADLEAQAPDHIAITGDLTNFSTREEFAAAARWLGGLGPTGEVTVSPGNHDALVGAAAAERFAAWRPWLGDEGGQAFPTLRRRGPVAIVNLCSAVPTGLHSAEGALDREQLQRLPALLRRAAEEGRFRIVLLHHPPTAGVVSRRKSLRNAGELLGVLQAEGAELVLHGHAHEATVGVAAGPRGPIPVLGVPPASGAPGRGQPGRWHAIEVQRLQGRWRVEVEARGLGAGGGVTSLGRYSLADVT